MKITSLQNERIKYFNKLKENKIRQKEQLYLIEDVDLLYDALNQQCVTVILYDDESIIKGLKLDDVELIEVNKEIIKKLSSLTTPGHFVAVCKMNKNKKECDHVIALDGVQDPGNGGTILRSALAFNFNEMLLSNDCFDMYNDKFIRATKGAFFHLPISKVNLVDEIKKRKENGYKIIVCDIDEKGYPLNKITNNEKVLIVVGSEGQGISNEVKELADEVVFITMSPAMESLNVAVAASLIMQRIFELDK